MAKETKPAAKETKPAPKETKPAPKENKEQKNITRSKKPNIFERALAGIQRYFNETTGELRKVHWPTRQEAWALTVIVLIVTGIMSVILGGFDYISSKLFEWLFALPI